MDTRFIEAVESTMTDTCQFWYVVIYSQDDELLACACLFTLPVDLGIVGGPAIRRIVNLIRPIYHSFLRVTALFCGLPVSIGQSALLLDPHVDVAVVLEKIDDLMHDIAAREGASFLVFKEFNDEFCDSVDVLQCREYFRADSLSAHHFFPRFRDLADYLSSLKSHYRYDIKRSQRKLDRAEMRIVRFRDPKSIAQVYTPEVHQLYLAVVDHASNKLELLPRQFFIELAENFPGEISLTAILDKDRVIAFNWALRDESIYVFLFCGIDYETNKEADLYFNVMYAELDHGLQENVRDILVGQTANDFKSRLGCRALRLFFYIKAVGAVSQWLLWAGFPLLFPAYPPGQVRNIYNSKAVGVRDESDR